MHGYWGRGNENTKTLHSRTFEQIEVLLVLCWISIQIDCGEDKAGAKQGSYLTFDAGCQCVLRPWNVFELLLLL